MKPMNIPIELLVYALSNRKVNPLRLFLYLKSQGSGYVDWTPEQKEKILSALNIKSPKTINANLKWLIKKGWVTVNSKRKSIRICGYKVIASKLQFRCFTGAVCEINIFTDSSLFRPFIYAAVITYYLKYNQRKARQLGREKGRPNLNCRYPNLPAKYLAEVMTLGKSTITRYRQDAWAAGFIKMKHRYKPLLISIEELDFYRTVCEEDSASLVVHHNQVKQQLANVIYSNIVLRTKPDLKILIRQRQKLDSLHEGF